MDDLFKKFINTGVGFLSQGNKAVQTAIEKLVKESKISEQEGKKIMDELLKSGESKRADLEKQFKGLTEDLRTRVGLKGEDKKTAAPKAKPAAKKPVASATTQAAGATKKAADKASAAATKTQRSAAKAGAPKKATVQSADDSGEALNAQ
jgi:polyhydroxyalkanoate synthesis regulator phasin